MTDKPNSTSTAPAYAPIDIERELGVPVTQRGQPDLRDYKPNRFIHKEEARARGWSRFWSGDACRHGHQASRAVSNPHQCSDCLRERDGEPPIYPRAKHQQFYKTTSKARAAVPAATDAPVVMTPPAPPEPDAADRKFLAALAESRHFAAAAASAGTTVALVQARISCNSVFRAAVYDLTERLQIPHPVQVSGTRELTREEHEIFCRTWVDTGSQSKARAAIGISASQMHDELARSDAFRDMFADAAPKAALALDDTAVDLSLSGNDKLLGKTLPAKLREQYTERMSVNMQVSRTDKMSDVQLSAEFQRMLKQLYLLDPKGMEQLLRDAEREAIHEFTDKQLAAISVAIPNDEDALNGGN